MKALIFEGKVIQIEERSFEVAPALKWIEVDSLDVKVGWEHKDNKFSAPLVVPLIKPPFSKVSINGLILAIEKALKLPIGTIASQLPPSEKD